MKKRILIIIITICAIILAITKYAYNEFVNDKNVIVTYDNIVNNDLAYQVNIKYDTTLDTYCSFDKITWYDIDSCNFELPPGEYEIYIKNENITTKKKFEIVSNLEGSFSTPLDKLETYYLALGGHKTLDITFDYPETFDKTVRYKIEDNNIISVDNNVITGLNVGTTTLKLFLNDGNTKIYNIEVTDLIQPSDPTSDKKYLPCKNYSEEEAIKLDKILESRIIEGGEGTRGGVLAAARFLTLEFPFSIRYFNENGRLVDHGSRPHIDAEGRYYHKGLYLSETKFNDLEPGAHTKTGPQIWGCNIYDKFIEKNNMNGFTCSGFVTWAMLNGGYPVGDVGAGDYKQYDDDLSDIGPHQELTTDYMQNGNYKVGDFIGRNGHAALIIGIDDENIYTAESLPAKLKVYTYERYKGIVKDTNLTYVIEMSDIYPNGDGYYKDMWE